MEDGTFLGRGKNCNGQLAMGHNNDVKDFSPIDGLDFVESVECGQNFTMFLATDGSVHGCGASPGNGLKKSANRPALVKGLTNVRQLSCGFLTSAAVDGQGAVYCWGDNSCFQLGLGHNKKVTGAHQAKGIPEAAT